jgi:hypothetical protein
VYITGKKDNYFMGGRENHYQETNMTVLIFWVARFLIAYWLIRIILLLVRGPSAKRRKAPEARNETVQRFDATGKNISEAEFKDIR